MFNLEKYHVRSAAATTALITAGLGVAMSGAQIAQGAKQNKDGKRALNDQERQELDNAFKETQISKFGSDLLREENARTSANLVGALQDGGARSIIGGIPKVVGATNQVNQEAAKLIDNQVINREYAIAQDNARIEGITENRDIANLSAISSQIQSGQQNMFSGMMGAASSVASLGRAPQAEREGAEFLDGRNAGLDSMAEINPQMQRAQISAPVNMLGSRFSVPQIESSYNNQYPNEFDELGYNKKYNKYPTF